MKEPIAIVPKAVIGIAIEDRVEIRFRRNNHNISVFEEDIPEGSSYYLNVRNLLAKGFEYITKEKNGELFKEDPGDIFNSVTSLVVSVPGVVENNKRLIQLPLWHSEWHETVHWKYLDKEKTEFDFGEEIADIISTLLTKQSWRRTERQRFVDSVFVVNDASACAAFEYIKRGGNAKVSDFVYIKIHNGVNVGVVEKNQDGKVVIKHVHAEAGHSFPTVYQFDAEANFQGVCKYHQWCFEGMIAAHSFYQRAIQAGMDGPFYPWKQHVEQLIKGGAHPGQQLDNDLVSYALGNNGKKPGSEGIKLMAHYVALLALQISIGPSAPEYVIMGGSMVSDALLNEVRTLMVRWSNGYPKRHELSAKGIADHVIPSIALKTRNQGGKVLAEVEGALAIAISRGEIHSSSNVTDISESISP